MHAWGELEKAEALEKPVETRYHDTSAILYTSGTTGPSKGVVLPYGVGGIFAQGIIEVAKLTSDDVSYVVHPLFHGNAQFMQVLPSLLVGARVSLWPGFSASRWLEQVRSLRRDDNQRLGVICNFVFSQADTRERHGQPTSSGDHPAYTGRYRRRLREAVCCKVPGRLRHDGDRCSDVSTTGRALASGFGG